MTAKHKLPLVLIEWEDSRQPSSPWRWLADMKAPDAVLCASVGWLTHDTALVKVLAANMGGVEDSESVQACGIITIPTRCVIKMTLLDARTRRQRRGV